MKLKYVFVVGFMLFAMFFGAGNLIFPPSIGHESGEHFWPGVIGFVLTGVGLPLIAVIAGAISKGGYDESLNHVSKWFSIAFMVAIFLTIGPFFAIPRTATTAYEMSILPYLSDTSTLSLLIFTLLYFLIVFLICLKPGYLVDTIGKSLTPILLITIVLLIIMGILNYSGLTPNETSGAFLEKSAFSVGFTEGYLTMDAIAAIVFSLIVINAIRGLGFSSKKDLLNGTIQSALLAAVLLGVIYVALAWIGNKVGLPGELAEDQNLGTFILTFVAEDVLGSFGVFVLATIVFLACLTTCVGLIVSVSEYFHELIPRVSYVAWVSIFILISLVLANQGLSTIIQGSVPVLMILYPIAMTVISLVIFTYFVPSPRLALQIPVYTVSIISILAVIFRSEYFGISALEVLPLQVLEYLPLFAAEFEWIPILIVGYIIGYVLGSNQPKIVYE